MRAVTAPAFLMLPQPLRGLASACWGPCLRLFVALLPPVWSLASACPGPGHAGLQLFWREWLQPASKVIPCHGSLLTYCCSDRAAPATRRRLASCSCASAAVTGLSLRCGGPASCHAVSFSSSFWPFPSFRPFSSFWLFSSFRPFPSFWPFCTSQATQHPGSCAKGFRDPCGRLSRARHPARLHRS